MQATVAMVVNMSANIHDTKQTLICQVNSRTVCWEQMLLSFYDA